GTSETFPLERDERGCWMTALPGIRNDDRYQFELNNDKNFPDPASRWQPEGVHEESAVAAAAFAWSDESWKGLPLGEMIIYELHVGTFTSQGTFDGVIDKLDHLATLGVNAIEIMPVAQFPGTRNWGYDGVFPFAVQHSYGGIQGLKKLVNEAHLKGIAVILDVVYNHQGPEGNYLAAFAPFFTDKYKTGWGSAINFDDAYCDGVRAFYAQNAIQWLDEFHIDGLRMDAVHAIWDFSAHHFIEMLREKVEAVEQATGRKKVLIAELDLNTPRYINPPQSGGYGMDGQWVDEFHHALHALVTGEVNGYYEDFGEVSHLAKAFRDSYVYTGQYSVHRKKHFGVLPAQNPYSQFVVFAQNHDQVGNRLLGDRLTTQLSFEALKLTAAVLLLSPHVPMLFMGEEYGEQNPFQYFISHTDKSLVEAVRKGRKEEFKYFGWKDEVPDPQAEETFRQCVLSWDWHADERRILLSWYRHLIAFRKSRAAMRGYGRGTVVVSPTTENRMITFERRADNDSILVVFNFNKTPAAFTPAVAGSLSILFDSSSQEWNGKGDPVPATLSIQDTAAINPESVVVFEIH
ncbi:MAG TPA: malto-oligosyltrehalose trehalohydrolase, partial [Ohtaekwangia sp.]|nr:malto-oligosyltrehalose trehalohydrolase [Ohtaekwangia sp.]